MIGWCSGKLYTLQHILGIKYTADNSLYPSSEKQDNILKNKPKTKVLDLLDLLPGNIWNELTFKDSR